MSERQERQFKVKEDDKSPFVPSKTNKAKASVGSNDVPGNLSKKKPGEEPRGPSGSLWGLEHLNWLHIHLALGHDWEELFSPGSEIPQSGEIATCLRQKLGAEWKWICDNDHSNSLSRYAFFQRLIRERREDDDWRTSTHASTDSSSPSSSKGQSSRHSISPQQNRQGILSRQGMWNPETCFRTLSPIGIIIMVRGSERASAAAVLGILVFQIKAPARKKPANSKISRT